MPVVLGVVAAGLVALELTLGAEGWMGLTALACVAGAVGFGLASLAVKIPPRDGVDNGGHVVPPNHS